MKSIILFMAGFCILTGNLSGCASKPPVFPDEPPYFNWIQDTAIDNFSLTGRAYFWPAPAEQGVKIELVLTGDLPEKKYYVQVHETGSCKNQAREAGSAFDPSGSWFFWDDADGFLGSVKIPENGPAKFSLFTKKLTLGGQKNNIAGKSIVISKDKKGLERIGCAVIPVPSKKEVSEN